MKGYKPTYTTKSIATAMDFLVLAPSDIYTQVICSMLHSTAMVRVSRNIWFGS